MGSSEQQVERIELALGTNVAMLETHSSDPTRPDPIRSEPIRPAGAKWFLSNGSIG